MSFDDAARQAADALGTEVGRALQTQLDQFVALVTEAATRERAQLTEQAQQAVTAAEQTLQDAIASARSEATQDAELRFEAALAERAALAEAASVALQATQASERAEWADRATRLEADLTERQERDAGLFARAQRAEEELARVEAELAARTERFETDLAAQLAEQTALTAQVQAAAQAQAAAESAAAAQAADAAQSAGDQVRRAADSAGALERLVSGFRTLDEGQSLSQLLDILAVQVGRNASRAAIFVVRGQPQQGAVLQGWAFSGFNGAPIDARSLSVPLDKLPALADVVMQGGRSEVHTAGFAAADVNPLAFMSVPRAQVGVAVPVLVGGQVAAVVYGDDGAAAPSSQDGDDEAASASASESSSSSASFEASGSDSAPGSASVSTVVPSVAVPSVVVPSVSWADALELLARHAARCLEAQTAIRAARLSSSAQPAPLVQPTIVHADAAGTNGAAGASGTASGQDASASGASPADPAADAYAEEHARRYARLLIADIRLYNETAVRAGREHRDLWHRLQPDIARARRAFEDRVIDIADRERLFDEELVRTLADGDESLLGFDLVRRPLPPAASSAERLAV